MRFYSTKNKSIKVSFEEAIRKGLADDGGLYMPERIEKLPEEFWKYFREWDFKELGFRVASHFLQNSIADSALRKIVDYTLSFDSPIKQITENIYSLELFHGPTLAFKDFGARFLAATLNHFAEKDGPVITILVATSGDTGSAVANGFHNLEGTHVVILYPSGKVSDFQERQMTTLGGNVTALEVNGTFDDCQLLVKKAFADKDLRDKMILTSANSINVGRLIPQMFYYFRALQILPERHNHAVAISVPSGNFGNLTAGLMAKRMGLPVDYFIASTNVNDVVPRYLNTGIFTPTSSWATLSNAMDVGNPSNFARILDLYDHDPLALFKDVVGYSFSDEETVRGLKELFRDYGYTGDPHGAVAYLGLKKFVTNNEVTGIFLETAHPVKFRETVEQSIGSSIPFYDEMLRDEKKSIMIQNDYEDLKDFLLK